MSEEHHNLVQFGRYSGMPYESIVTDARYILWLIAQDWLEERDPALHHFVHTRFRIKRPTDTWQAREAACAHAERRIVKMPTGPKGDAWQILTQCTGCLKRLGPAEGVRQYSIPKRQAPPLDQIPLRVEREELPKEPIVWYDCCPTPDIGLVRYRTFDLQFEDAPRSPEWKLVGWCSACGTELPTAPRAIRPLPRGKEEWDAIPVFFDEWDDPADETLQAVFGWFKNAAKRAAHAAASEQDSSCAVCGRDVPLEDHHFAPWFLFGPEASAWPVKSLCRACHLRWHGKLTPNSGQRDIWTQRALVWSFEGHGWRAEYKAVTVGWVVVRAGRAQGAEPSWIPRRWFVEDAARNPVGNADGYENATEACRVLELELM